MNAENAPISKRDLLELEARLDARLKVQKTGIVDEMTGLMGDAETCPVSAFRGYGKGQSTRMHSLEVSQPDVNIRLAAFEERVLNLETRRGPGSH